MAIIYLCIVNCTGFYVLVKDGDEKILENRTLEIRTIVKMFCFSKIESEWLIIVPGKC